MKIYKKRDLNCVSTRVKSLNTDLCYDALARSQNGWHDGKEDFVPFVKYILGTILAAYRDFEERVSLVEVRLSAAEMVRRASMNKIGRFNHWVHRLN